MYTRRYRVNPTVFIQNLQSATGTETEVKPGPGLQALIRTHFHSKGVEFPAPSGISTNVPDTDRKAFFLNDRTGILFVRANETELNRIESIVSELSPRSDRMIQFETRIVELPADALDEIGLPPGKITLPSNQIDPARRTVLTPGDLGQMLTQIGSSPHGSLVRSSRITTVEGLNATLHIGSADAPTGPETERSITLHLQSKIETGPDPLRLSINLVGQAVALPESSSARTSPNLRPYVLSHFQLPFGNTVAMLMPNDSNSPTALHHRLILITPTLIDPAGNQLAP